MKTCLTNKIQNLYYKMPSRKKLLEKGRSATVATLKATKIKKENGCLKNIGYGLVNFLGHHQVLGCLPGKVQKNLSDEAGIPKTLMTWESIGFGILLGILKCASGDVAVDSNLTIGGYLLQLWGAYRLTEAAIRIPYTFFTKKPLGLLIIELAYKLNPSKYEFKDESLSELERSLYNNVEKLNTECISEYYEN